MSNSIHQLNSLWHRHYILKARTTSNCFGCLSFLGRQIKDNYIDLLKWKIHRFLKLEPTQNWKEIHLFWISYFYRKIFLEFTGVTQTNLPVTAICNRIEMDTRTPTIFSQSKTRMHKWNTLFGVTDINKPDIYILCEACYYGYGAALPWKNKFKKKELISANFCLSSTVMKLSAIFSKYSAIIHALSEFDFFNKVSLLRINLYGSQTNTIFSKKKTTILISDVTYFREFFANSLSFGL